MGMLCLKMYIYIYIMRPLSIEILPETLLINGHAIKVEMLANKNSLLGANNLFDNHKNVLPGNGLILTTNCYCFSLIWAKQNIYFIDPHSINTDGSFIASGSSILIAFKTY